MMRSVCRGFASASLALIVGACGSSPPPPTAPTCDHESADAGVEAPTCDMGEVQVVGALGGQPVSGGFTPGSLVSTAQYFTFGTFGTTYFPDAEGKPGETTAVRGLLRFPDEDPQRANSWYCAGEGSEVSVSKDVLSYSATLDSLSSLGSCESGEPVSGQVETCYSSADCGFDHTRAVSTLSDASFDIGVGTGNSSTVTGTPTGSAYVTLTSVSDPTLESGFIRIESTTIDPSNPNTTGTLMTTLSRGFLIVPSGAPDAGAVYCVGEDSSLEYRMQAGAFVPVRSTFKSLKRIGACPATDACTPGQLRICGDLHTP